MSSIYKLLLILILLGTTTNAQNSILEGVPFVTQKQSKIFFKSNKNFSKIIIKRNSDFKLDLKKSSYQNNNLEKVVYRAIGPENYKSFNKRIGYMDLNKILGEILVFLENNSFNINYQSSNYYDIINFFEKYETILIEANNGIVNLEVKPEEHDLNYSLFIEISNL